MKRLTRRPPSLRRSFLLSHLIHNKWSCCGWQEHEEEMPRRDHDWHFVINQILSVLKTSSLQTDCQETIIPPLAGRTDSWSSPASVTVSDFLPAAADAAHKEPDWCKEKLHPPWLQRFKLIRLSRADSAASHLSACWENTRRTTTENFFAFLF